MNKNSSNKTMEEHLELLKRVKTVDTPNGLYDKIEQRIYAVSDKISLKWVRAAAAILLLVVGGEMILIFNSDSKESTTISSLIPSTNNNFYHE